LRTSRPTCGATCTRCGIGCRRGLTSRRRCVRCRSRSLTARSGCWGCRLSRIGLPQTVVAARLEARVEPMFHPDSYGYRPRRSALDAVAVTRRRCWSKDWVLDLDIRAFFDSVDHDLLIKAVEANTEDRWVVLYVRRWLAAPMVHPDGTVQDRDRGTPQGSAVSPVLANLFLHYGGCPDVRGTSVAGPVSIRLRSRLQCCTGVGQFRGRHAVRGRLVGRAGGGGR